VQLLGLAAGVLGPTHIEERLLGQVVEVALAQRLERVDGLVDRRGDARAGR
jgi:hypothetical protein